MIELAKHIEVLLLENDCVIVPGLGGFIAHYRPSVYKEDTGTFCPPMRTIGFNPQLVMNDGLLVQSYMQAYNTDFPDATRKIEKIVGVMKEKLYQRGQITLNNVGTLYYNMNGAYEFAPLQNGFFTPSLYGLEPFRPSPLQKLPEMEVKQTYRPEPAKKNVPEPVSEPAGRRIIPLRTWLKNAVAVAAAVILFFILSVPAENTYVSETNYASLGSYTLFDAIRSESAASSVMAGPQNQTEKKHVTRNNVNTLRPASVRTERVAPARTSSAQTSATGTATGTKPETTTSSPASSPQTASTKTGSAQPEAAPEKKTGRTKEQVPAAAPSARKGCYVIVASLQTADDAQREVRRLQGKGFGDAQVVESQGRYRIAVACYPQASDAYKKVQELKKTAGFESAWVYTAK